MHDLIVAGNDCHAIKHFMSYLHACFHVKDLSPLKYFLGVEVAHSSSGIYLCQRKYTLDIICEIGLLGAKPAATPLEQNHHLALIDGPIFPHPDCYRRIIGRLIYLCFTRPKLSYYVHMLSQFMQQPKEVHWNAALHVVRYLKGNLGQGVLVHRDNNLLLSAWWDFDWASCPLIQRSLTSWIIFLGNSPISCKTKKQHIMSRSFAEAKYRSIATTTCELKWLKSIMHYLGITHSSPIHLYCDSQAALHIAKNLVFHERKKHIEVDCHFVRDAVLAGVIQPSYVSIQTQLVDLHTKALGRNQFHFLIGKLGIHNLHAPTLGGYWSQHKYGNISAQYSR